MVVIARGQFSNLHTKKIQTVGLVAIDKLSIVPTSVVINEVDTNSYFIDYLKATILWKRKQLSDSVLITYRTFPLSFYTPVRRFNYDSLNKNFLIHKSVIFNPNAFASNNLFNFGNGVSYNGSIGRSLTVGNSQSAVFNSQLNLQLSGLIGDSIMMSAAITDNNIPIQPDGTTKQLNEFDKVLLQFKKHDWELDLGDIDIRQNKNYFLNFSKRLQGLSYQQQTKAGKDGGNKLMLSGAIAKGKFTRNIFNGQEGNQGPYRLQGANNELYFVVLANTEHVFLDGELLQRGEDQDYTINYNSAEITFTPKRMITVNKRIQLEFEYADQNYLNVMLYANDEIKINKRLTVAVGIYDNSDAKHSPINQSLDSNQTRFLANIGDSIQNAFYPCAGVDTFNAAQIMYAKVKLPNFPDSVYQYSTSPDSAHYVLNFVQVGNNKGNYVPYFNGANGNVYQFAAPINGVKQGNYEPAIFLVTPKTQQIVNLSSTYLIDKKNTLQTDVAVSNYNANTLSTLQKNNDVGMAARVMLLHQDTLRYRRKPILYNSTFGYEYAGENFKPIERVRSVEFQRDWGLNLSPTNATEHLPSMSVELKDTSNNTFKYIASGYLRSDDYKGFRQSMQDVQTLSAWHLQSNVSLTNSETGEAKGYYFKPSFDVSRPLPYLKQLTIGGGYSLEQNKQRTALADTLSPNSFDFNTVTAYLKSNQAKANKWTFTYTTRTDKQAYQQSFVQIDRSHNYNLLLELLQNKKQQLRVDVTYRQLQVYNQTLTNLTPDNSLLGRVEYVLNGWNGFVTGNSLYEVGSGQQQQLAISYVQVPAGQGQYTWIDYNHDGIQQLNEFEISPFADQATYIRLYTPTNVYVKTNNVQFNYSLVFNPKAITKGIENKRLKDLIGRFNIQSSLQSGKKVLAQKDAELNPLGGAIADTALVSLKYVFSNTLSFNRMSSKWGIDVSKLINYNKSLLSYGLQSNQLNEWGIKARANFDRKYTIDITQKIGSNSLLTPSYSNQNYYINYFSTEPKLTFTNATLFRLQASYLYSQKKNELKYGGESEISNSLSLEAKYNAVQNTSVTSKLTLNNINYNGLTNTATSYIMLDGLLPGKNLLWNLDFTKRLINNLEISFSYEGRKAGDSKVINTGRASLRALL